MTVALVRTLFDYHYARLREVWASIDTLSEEQFITEVAYSHGSLRNQAVHLVDDDLSWLAFLQRESRPAHLRPQDFGTRAAVRAAYDVAEARVLDYVYRVEDVALSETYIWEPPPAPRPQQISALQIMVHMVNHGTDHRAQMLRVLHDMGTPTFDQDLMAYLWQSGKAAID